ncbi:MAG: cysteine--tRNA ligase [Patescibacteria group bacterium]
MLKLHNTLTRKKEVFRPNKKKAVGLYTCGPTVYNTAHIGNLRTYIFEDVLRRSLEYLGYEVKQVMNITDIEDKIIKKSVQDKKSLAAITRPYIEEFFEDIDKLNIEKAHEYPLATTHLKEIIEAVRKLVQKGFAYEGKDGSVYFNISKFKKYGKLVGMKNVKIKDGARVSSDEYQKDEARDFVLWKAQKKGEPGWKSPWGLGRPGWHIECSIMSMRYLGETIDIHTGGIDNIFPHHDNEIAQSEALTGKKFVNYWVHGEHLMVNEEKMSKSLKNFYTLRDIEKKGFLPASFRYLILGAHYQSKLNFTWRSLQGAENAIWNLWRELGRLRYMGSKDTLKTKKGRVKEHKANFIEAIEDNLDMPRALAILRRVITDPYMAPEDRRALSFQMDKVFGLDLKKTDKLGKIPLHVKTLVTGRELMRRNQQFVKADTLRNKVASLGYEIEDTLYGPFVWPKQKRNSHHKT